MKPPWWFLVAPSLVWCASHALPSTYIYMMMNLEITGLSGDLTPAPARAVLAANAQPGGDGSDKETTATLVF